MNIFSFIKENNKKISIIFVIFFAILFIFRAATTLAAPTWIDQTTFGSKKWTGLALSYDGTVLIAADNTDTSSNLYKFTYNGTSWATSTLTNAGTKQWKHVACSYDCNVVLASEQTGHLWLSNDSGTTWSDQSNAGSGSWTGVAVSASGTTLAAISNGGGQIGYWVSTSTSMSGGGNWSHPSGLNSLTPNTISMSSDGTKLAVGMFGNYIYTSTTTGVFWTQQTNSNSTFWTGIGMSGDGTKIAAPNKFSDNNVWTSTTSGQFWTQQTNSGTGSPGLWSSIAVSGDGSRMAVVSDNGPIAMSLSGNPASWATSTSPAGNNGWVKVTSNFDGRVMAAGLINGDIWTFSDPIVVLPTVIVATTTSIGVTSATFNGNITLTGNENATVRGFNYGTSTTPYAFTASSSGSFSAGVFSATTTSLVCGTTYHVQAFATNSAGTATSSDTTFSTLSCPVAPTVTTGTSTNVTSSIATLGGNITVSGGASSTSRYIKYSTDLSYSLQSAADTGNFDTGAFTENISGLTAGTTYNYKACAVSSGGTGCGSNATFTTLDVPGTPTSLGATAGYTQASLSWTDPSSGGSAITDYLIEYKSTSGAIWSVFSHAVSASTTSIVTGLTNGVSYDFRVSALNTYGYGPSSATASVTPSSTPTAPNAPTSLTATSGSSQVSLSWTAPVNNGGASINNYLVQYKTLAAGSYTTFSHATSTATSIVVTGLTNGTSYNFKVSAINSAGTGTASNILTTGAGQVYFHILSTGQSLSEGVNSSPALSTTQPYNNLSLSNSPDGGLSAPLIPLVESVNSRESPASGLANSLRASDTILTRPIVYTGHGGGGQSYSEIKKGGSSSNYANGQTQISVSKTQVESAGGYYQPLALVVVHGETDGINGVGTSTYAGYMQQMQSDYESDWNTVVGISRSIPLFESQNNSNSMGNIAQGQFDAHRNNPGKVILVGPKYQIPYFSDHLHLSNTGSKFMGELYAKVMKKVLVDGQTWNPLMPTQITRSGNIVTINYNIPFGNLVIDTTTVAARTNYGFEFTQTGGATTTISSVSLIASSTQVQITLSGTPTGTNQHIRYAWSCENHPNDAAYSTCADPTDSGANGGNIRDTDNSVSPSSAGTGLPLYDWSVTFDEPIYDPSVPGAPTSLSGTPGNTQVALTWTAPALNGGSTITDYFIEYRTRAASTWSTFSDGVSTSTSATVTGLTNGTNYEFRVSAINVIGTGTASNVIVSTQATTPGVPTSLSATGGVNGQVPLTWVMPVSNGGSDITDYLVEYKLSATSTWSTFSDGVSIATGTTVTGLTNGLLYNFRVSATNLIGTGSVSSTANATPNTNAPDAPTSLVGTAGNTQVSLTWSTPISNGGSAITNYFIEYKLSATSTWSTFSHATSTATSSTITSLTNGTNYDFRVSAINSVGTGSVSNTATVIPATVPGVPTSLAGVIGDSQVSLTWTAPADSGGSSITDYLIEFKDSATSTWSTFSHATSTATSSTITSLTNGTSYDFQVSAINGSGTGLSSGTITATPLTTPSVPVSFSGTSGDTQVLLSWTAPVSNGGSAITNYFIEYKLSATSTWSTFSHATSTATSSTITSLTNGTSYDFRVSAINSVGTGSVSGTATITPSMVPVVVVVPERVSHGNSHASVEMSKIVNPNPLIKNTYISPLDKMDKVCPALTNNLKLNAKTNSIADVKFLQAFLDVYNKEHLPLTGYFGPQTFAAVKRFQNLYKKEILIPAKLKNPTGIVAGGTRAQVNKLLGCQ